MAFPTIQAADTKSGTQTSNANQWSATYPTNLASGDLILLFVAADGGGVASATGFNRWTASSANVSATVLAKISDGTESSSFTVNISASEQGAWRAFRITGWKGDALPASTTDNSGGESTSFAVAARASGASANPDPTLLNPTNWDVEDTLWFAICSADTSRTISVYPLADNNTADVSGGAGGATLGVCTTASAVASLDPSTFTISASDDWTATTIAIRPASVSGYTLTAEAGSFGLSGVAATLKMARKLAAEAGALSLSGTAAALKYGWKLTAGEGSLGLTGVDAALRHDMKIPAGAGAFDLVGIDATLTKAGGGYTVTAEAGALTLTGNAAVPQFGRHLVAEPGTISVSGVAAVLRIARRLTAEAAAFVLGGQAAGLMYGRHVVAEGGAYVLTGVDAVPRLARKLLAAVGVYVVSGTEAQLVWSGESAPTEISAKLTRPDLPGISRVVT